MCPRPSLIAMRALKTLVAGQVLRVLVGSKKSVETVRRQLSKQKVEWLKTEPEEDYWVLYYQRVN
jgi:TusA-related sulfurtransferase